MSGKQTQIIVSDRDFLKGFQSGYIRFATQSGTQLADDSLYQFLFATITDESVSNREKSGFLSGWYAAMYRIPYHFDRTSPIRLHEVKGGV
jgi:hypothetical protein